MPTELFFQILFRFNLKKEKEKPSLVTKKKKDNEQLYINNLYKQFPNFLYNIIILMVTQYFIRIISLLFINQ